ncbi:hypothetical protein ABB22_01370 [Stenotrophomonas nitritireducens]|uniref:Uncharacterized protein n=1 Tax=Stenotrophomonas nitritireducens TaxID=83617 RepID=A0ABR5NP69_9GAMM|nr:hypothetical protein ABB22_01370 [Stenotrophomonas nitritireducens]
MIDIGLGVEAPDVTAIGLCHDKIAIGVEDDEVAARFGPVFMPAHELDGLRPCLPGGDLRQRRHGGQQRSAKADGRERCPEKGVRKPCAHRLDTWRWEFHGEVPQVRSEWKMPLP